MHISLEYHWNINIIGVSWKGNIMEISRFSKQSSNLFILSWLCSLDFLAPNLLNFPNSPNPWKPRCSLLFRGTLLVMPDWVVVSSRLPEKPRQWLETLFLCGGKRVDWRIAAYDEISWCFRLSFNSSETYAPQICRENFHKMDFIGSIHAFDSRIGNPARNKNPGVQRRKSSPRNQKTTKNIHHSVLMWRISSYIQVVSNPSLFSHLSSRSPHVDSVLTLQLKPFHHHPPLLFVPQTPTFLSCSVSTKSWANLRVVGSTSNPQPGTHWAARNKTWFEGYLTVAVMDLYNLDGEDLFTVCFNSKEWDGLLMLTLQMVIKVGVEYPLGDEGWWFEMLIDVGIWFIPKGWTCSFRTSQRFKTASGFGLNDWGNQFGIGITDLELRSIWASIIFRSHSSRSVTCSIEDA